MDLVIRNGTLFTSGGPLQNDVGIVGERIAAIEKNLEGTKEIDAAGCYVLPGGVDPHVHLQMDAGEYVSADDFASGTVAAALGGTTTVIDFVEPDPGEGLMEALARRRAEADDQVAVDYGLHMTIPAWHAAHPESLAELPAVVEAGVSTFKLYLAYEGLRLDDPQLYRVMADLAEIRGLPFVHCENGPICELLRSRAVAQGETSPLSHAATRPPRQEAEAVSRAIDVAALAGSPVYIAHVSCRSALTRIRAARSRGEAVYGETCPQYLLLDQAVLAEPGGERMICAPPLRVQTDREALWEGLMAGLIDVLATDHCPFTAAEKAGHADFTTIPGGLPSVEARIGLAHDIARRSGTSLDRWAQICSASPARIFGLRQKGQIAIGLDADLIVFDPEMELRIEAGKTLHEKVDWTPYAGMQIRGWTRDVVSRGAVIVRQGEFTGRLGHGRFVRRAVSVNGGEPAEGT
jgi:dihydropyrimidinase